MDVAKSYTAAKAASSKVNLESIPLKHSSNVDVKGDKGLRMTLERATRG